MLPITEHESADKFSRELLKKLAQALPDNTVVCSQHFSDMRRFGQDAVKTMHVITLADRQDAHMGVEASNEVLEKAVFEFVQRLLNTRMDYVTHTKIANALKEHLGADIFEELVASLTARRD